MPDFWYYAAPSAFVMVLNVTFAIRFANMRRELQGKLNAYRTLFDVFPAPAYLYDLNDFGIVAVNEQAVALYGYSKEDFLSLKAPDLIMSGKFRPLMLETSERQTNLVNYGRWQHRKQNGEVFHVQLFVQKLQFNKHVAGLALIYDIAELIATENKLAKTTAVLDILNVLSDALYIVDRNWQFTYVNETYEKIQGKSRKDLLGKNIWEMFPYGKELRYYTAYHQALDNQTSVHFEEFNTHNNMWVKVDAYPSIGGLAVFFSDCTFKNTM